MRILAALLSFILTSYSMFNNEAPYKYFSERKGIRLSKPFIIKTKIKCLK